jgi:D-alanine-D-alanine ligase-like ATP-grasp enzyme
MKPLKRIIYAWIDKTFLGGCSNYNPLSTRKSCRSKKQARDMFAQHGIPHARGEIFYGWIKPFRFVKQHGFPVVVKPNVSGFSRGSHFPITTYRELLKAVVLVKIWWPGSVIEQYLSGQNFRVVVVKDEIMSVIRRYPPFVTGDGRTPIKDLIDRENRIREKMQLYPVIHPIPKNRKTARFLKKSHLTFASVPAEGRVVYLHNRVALAPGGVVETLDTGEMHEANKALFLKIVPLFKANILGIDAIFEKGIHIPYTEQRAIFLEVNSRPYLKMHHFPRYGKKQDLQRFYDTLDSLDITHKDIF